MTELSRDAHSKHSSQPPEAKEQLAANWPTASGPFNLLNIMPQGYPSPGVWWPSPMSPLHHGHPRSAPPGGSESPTGTPHSQSHPKDGPVTDVSALEKGIVHVDTTIPGVGVLHSSGFPAGRWTKGRQDARTFVTSDHSTRDLYDSASYILQHFNEIDKGNDGTLSLSDLQQARRQANASTYLRPGETLAGIQYELDFAIKNFAR
jgi:hypothetical protein